jgi:hypothetical protein
MGNASAFKASQQGGSKPRSVGRRSVGRVGSRRAWSDRLGSARLGSGPVGYGLGRPPKRAFVPAAGHAAIRNALRKRGCWGYVQDARHPEAEARHAQPPPGPCAGALGTGGTSRALRRPGDVGRRVPGDVVASLHPGRRPGPGKGAVGQDSTLAPPVCSRSGPAAAAR